MNPSSRILRRVSIVALALIFGGLVTVPPQGAHAVTGAATCGVGGFASGDGTVASPYVIMTADQLAAIDQTSDQTSNLGCVYVLGANIDVSGRNWLPIGTRCTPGDFNFESCDNLAFTGTFDGGNYTISNLTITSTTNRRFNGLFGKTSGAVIKKLNFNNVTIDSARAGLSNGGTAGALVGEARDTTIEDIAVTGDVTIASVEEFGTVAGIVFETTMSRIAVSGNITLTIRRSGYGQVGGVVGTMLDSSSLTDVEVNGLVVGFEDVNTTTNRAYFIGGLVGRLLSNSSVNTGAVRGLNLGGGPYEQSRRRFDGAGGAVGLQSNSSVFRVLVEGEVRAGPGSGEDIGGLVGRMQPGSTLKWSKALAFVGEVQDSDVGGLVGDASGQVLIEDSYFEGTVEGFPAAGGLIGRLRSVGWDDDDVEVPVIRRTYARGPVVGTGGFVGEVEYEGYFAPSPVIEGSVWDIEQSGQESTDDGIAPGLSSVDMKLLTTYAGFQWNIVEGVATFAGTSGMSAQESSAIWGICDGSIYPFLQWEYETDSTPIDPCTLDPNVVDPPIVEPGGLGTIERPTYAPDISLDHYYERLSEEVTELPDTGRSSSHLVLAGNLLLAFGFTLLGVRRRTTVLK